MFRPFQGCSLANTAALFILPPGASVSERNSFGNTEITNPIRFAAAKRVETEKRAETVRACIGQASFEALRFRAFRAAIMQNRWWLFLLVLFFCVGDKRKVHKVKSDDYSCILPLPALRGHRSQAILLSASSNDSTEAVTISVLAPKP